MKKMEISHSYKGLSHAYFRARKGTPEFVEFMISHVGFGSDRKRALSIVELGAGAGQQTEFVEKKLNSLGILQYKIFAYDKSADQLGLLKDRIIKGEISKKVVPAKLDFDNSPLPIEPESVDLTYMAWVLHHLTNQQGIIDKIAKASRTGARLFMYQVTIEDLENHPLNEFFPMKYEYDKKRYPTLPQLEQMFFNAGFTFGTPYIIKNDEPKVFNRELLESIIDTTLDSVLTMIKTNDPNGFNKGVHQVELEVDRGERSGKYRRYNRIDRSIFWGFKQ